MSRARAKNRKAKGRAGAPAAKSVGGGRSATSESGKESAEGLVAKAEAFAASEREQAGEGADAVTHVDLSGEVTVERLAAALQNLLRAQDLANRRQRAYETGMQDVDKQRQALDERETRRKVEHETRSTALQALQEELDSRDAGTKVEKEKLAEESKRLAGWEARLFALEQAAHSDFADYRHEQLQKLREELAERRAAAEEEEEQQVKAATRRVAEAELELTQRAAKIDAYGSELDRRAQELVRNERRLTAREQDLVQMEADRRKESEARFAGELEHLRHELDASDRRYEAVAALARSRAEKLAEHGAAELAVGGKSLLEVAAELDELRNRNTELSRELAARPTAALERLADLDARCQELSVDRDDLLRQNEEMRLHIAASRISVAEQQTSQVINNALEQLNKTLRQEISDQSAKLEELESQNGQRSPFPACAEMDLDPTYAREPELRTNTPSLSVLVSRVRAVIAREERLYYSERDLRCFLGGLAASRLHLLQGISGIGKTRLPLAFARAIGAGSATVAVVAEWRSPQDLMGYYNAFERKFYETDFTKALYRARLPLFSSKPYLVVLDEMNLSHPEQYFSDLLHALELRESGPQWLSLMTSRVDPAPRLLRAGCDLLLPDNVWFVGTANHDETTVSFADKTYDRAHVLELPARPEPFDPGDAQPLAPLSLAALNTAFEDARHQYAGDTDKVLDLLDNGLGHRLRQGFGISWGSRLTRQAESFIPVVRAAGGEIGEAADHLLATKVLRKLQGRVEVPANELQALRSELQALWPTVCELTEPTDSLRVLDDEIRYRGVL
ncbi:AAA family ATPase [Streptomyces antimycoticus]|uniref:AAA family ATPase n=1 Tax=Streptomyces antimycoticus TaxID=68175 RepID=UPI0036E66D08